jgi:hypothetical protein
MFLKIGRAFGLVVDRDMAFSDKLKRLSSRAASAIGRKTSQSKHQSTAPKKPSASDGMRPKKPAKNGIAMFRISAGGNISRNPEQLLVHKKFCRLENIDIVGKTCVITDVASCSLSLYDLTQDPTLRRPVQTVRLGKATPHGAKFSPDGKLLVVSSLGLKVVNQEAKFCEWESPREDKIFVFERAI